jgi:uncharacterized protein (DUF1800 family)
MNLTDSVAHLLRRAGFGATSAEVSAATAAGYSATVDRLIGDLSTSDTGAATVSAPMLSPPPLDLRAVAANLADRQALTHTLAAERLALTNWWLARMTGSTNPLAEKLTFLLHGHFPTAVSKVRFPLYMYGQNQLFRKLGPGPFDALTLAVATDPAMLIWLDAASDKAAAPNENFARELMERFTMGIGNYTEADVRAGAACFTGWRFSHGTGSFWVNPRQHDPQPQTFLSTSGINSGQQVIGLVTHSQASLRYVPAAFWSHLAYPVRTTDPIVSDLAAVYGQSLNLTDLLRAIFEHPAFTSEAATGGLIKQPTEYVVGILRAFGVTPAQVSGSRTGRRLQAALSGLGQVLFDPPSVGGWPQNSYWLSTAAALTRWRLATEIVRFADISPVADAAASSRLDAAAALLSVPSWTTPTASALRQVSAQPRALLALALVSPEYVSN